MMEEFAGEDPIALQAMADNPAHEMTRNSEPGFCVLCLAVTPAEDLSAWTINKAAYALSTQVINCYIDTKEAKKRMRLKELKGCAQHHEQFSSFCAADLSDSPGFKDSPLGKLYCFLKKFRRSLCLKRSDSLDNLSDEWEVLRFDGNEKLLKLNSECALLWDQLENAQRQPGNSEAFDSEVHHKESQAFKRLIEKNRQRREEIQDKELVFGIGLR